MIKQLKYQGDRSRKEIALPKYPTRRFESATRGFQGERAVMIRG